MDHDKNNKLLLSELIYSLEIARGSFIHRTKQIERVQSMYQIVANALSTPLLRLQSLDGAEHNTTQQQLVKLWTGESCKRV